LHAWTKLKSAVIKFAVGIWYSNSWNFCSKLLRAITYFKPLHVFVRRTVVMSCQRVFLQASPGTGTTTGLSRDHHCMASPGTTTLEPFFKHHHPEHSEQDFCKLSNMVHFIVITVTIFLKLSNCGILPQITSVITVSIQDSNHWF
jgi:hypothetical protein